MGWVLQIGIFSSTFATSATSSLSSQPLFWRTDKNCCDVRWTKTYHQAPSWHLLSKCCFTCTSSNAFPKAILPSGDHINAFQKEPPVLQLYSSVLVIGWVVVLFNTGGFLLIGNFSHLGTSDICTCVYAETASFSFSATLGSCHLGR